MIQRTNYEKFIVMLLEKVKEYNPKDDVFTLAMPGNVAERMHRKRMDITPKKKRGSGRPRNSAHAPHTRKTTTPPTVRKPQISPIDGYGDTRYIIWREVVGSDSGGFSYSVLLGLRRKPGPVFIRRHVYATALTPRTRRPPKA